VRAVVDAAAKEATAYQRQLAAAEDAEMLKKFDPAKNDLIRLTDAERGAFMKPCSRCSTSIANSLETSCLLTWAHDA